MKRALGFFLCLACGCANNNGSSGDGGSGCTLIDGVCLSPPAMEAQRTVCGDVTDYCAPSAAAPSLECLASPKLPVGGPQTVTLTGFVDVFSAGPDSRGVSIAVFDATPLLAGQDIAQVTPIVEVPNVQLDPATMRACDKDAKKGCSLPSLTGCAVPVCNDGLMGRADDKKYCRDDGGTFTCEDRLRWEARYEIANVPTNQQLVVRVTGPNGQPDSSWAVLYIWNTYLASDARACTDAEDYDCLDTTGATPRFQLNVNALSQTDYVNIPVTSGLSGGIAMGRGATAGEIHDCDNVRIEHAVVSVTPMGDRFTYFNGNPLRTLPEPTRVATDRLGLYAALNQQPGKVKVVAGGLIGGTLTHLGSFEGYVYPDSVSVIYVNGGKRLP